MLMSRMSYEIIFDKFSRAFNPFYVSGLLLYPLKTSENQSPVSRTGDT